MSGNADVTARCVNCGRPLAGRRDARTCSSACRQQLYRRRQKAAADLRAIDAFFAGDAELPNLETLPPAPPNEEEWELLTVWRELREEYGDDLTVALAQRVIRNRLKRKDRERLAAIRNRGGQA